MRGSGVLVVIVALAAGAGAWACGSSAASDSPGDDAGTGTDEAAADTGAQPPVDASAPDAAEAAAPAVDTLSANRDRLLGTYLAYLKATPGKQSNGLDGSKLAGVCELWRTLNPSAQGVYLTLTARLQGSRLAADASSMLFHATRLYRVAGGDGATGADPGACGGDGNRILLSIDEPLHHALLVANSSKGLAPDGGVTELADVPIGAGSFWRDSHDLGGAHAPFDLSDETENGGPRGQVQLFASTTTPAASQPLGRTDLLTLVDPYALEVDQDYDCAHSSNPLCDYVLYGPLCAPAPSKAGTAIFAEKYGAFDPTWQPVDCAGK
jgi:hypothetical protein